MKIVMASMAVLALSAGAALADGKPSEAQAATIAATAKAWGCTGGTAEAESEATGALELNDAKCADGNNYDIKLDAKGKVISITAD